MNRVPQSLSALQQYSTFQLAFRVRQPLPEQAQSCLILLHGAGGSETDLADLATGIDPNALVVLPRGPLARAPGRHAWFPFEFAPDGPRIDAEKAEESRHALIDFITELQSVHGIDASHTVISGFSQGGILSASVALTTPELVAGFAILSGRILPELKPHFASRKRLSALHAFIGHGTLDRTLPVAWAQIADRWLTELGVRHVTHLYSSHHALSHEMSADFIAWAENLLGASR